MITRGKFKYLRIVVELAAERERNNLSDRAALKKLQQYARDIRRLAYR